MKNLFYKMVVVSVLLSSFIMAQEGSKVFSYGLGADLVSRYVWRGLEFGGTPAVPQIQPYASLNFQLNESNKFEIGAWASYGLTGSYNENDLYAKYTFSTAKAGSFALVVNDYYYPYLGIPFTKTESDGLGAHTIEAGFIYTGCSCFPVSLTISKNVHNDAPDFKSIYIEAGYALTIQESTINLFVGAAQGKSLWYLVSTDKFEVINLGLSFTKSVKISDEFSIPLTASWIMNPHMKNTFLVFKASI